MIYLLLALSTLVYVLLTIYINFNKYKRHFHSSSKPLQLSQVPNQFLFFGNEKDLKRNWIENVPKRTYWITALAEIRSFIGLFSIIALIFSAFQFWVKYTTQVDVAKASILQIEKAQHALQSYAEWFKLSFGWELFVFSALIVISLVHPQFAKYKASQKFAKYYGWFKKSLGVLAVATSFTFFGNQFAKNEEGRVGNLEFHKIQILDNNKLLLKGIQNEISERVVQEIVAHEDVNEVFQQIDSIQAMVASYTNNELYNLYKRTAPDVLLRQLPASEEKVTADLDFANILNRAEDQFEWDCINNKYSSAAQFYEKQEYRWASQVVDLGDNSFRSGLTATATEEAKARFATISQEIKAVNTVENIKYYEALKDPISKMIKKGYALTGEKAVQQFVEFLGVNFPFLDKFLDPLLHEPIQEVIVSESQKILKDLYRGDDAAAKAKMNSVVEAVKSKFNPSASVKFNELKAGLKQRIQEIKATVANSISAIRQSFQSADSYLAQMDAANRWERIRKRFSDNFSNGYYDDMWNADQKAIVQKMLDNWEQIREANKLNWMAEGKSNIESEFYRFVDGDADAAACWGFILQQEDWDGAVDFYTRILPDATASGRPKYLLKYYLHSTGHVDEIDNFYSDDVDVAVGKVCPPEH